MKLPGRGTAIVAVGVAVTALGWAGIDGGGFNVGALTRTDSLMVNTISYDTSGAEFIIDGAPGTIEELKDGQVVAVEGPVVSGAGVASSVEFADNVEGPVQSIGPQRRSLTVLGQAVRVDAATRYGASAQPLARLPRWIGIGDPVEVSGIVEAGGGVLATYIRLGSPSNLEVTGRVAMLDPVLEQLSVNDLVVDYSGADLIGFGDEGPTEGDTVEAKGLVLGPAGELLATELFHRNTGLTGEPGYGVILDGFVTAFQSPRSFAVAGTSIRTDADTEWDDGRPRDLALNVRVVVEGEFVEDGVVLADEVEFQDDGGLDAIASVRGYARALIELIESSASSAATSTE